MLHLPEDDRYTQLAARTLLAQLDEPAVGDDPADDLALRQQVRAAVYYLLTRDFERLIRVCYRLDVPETDFAQALGGATMDAVAENLADAMIRRERQRLTTRSEPLA